MYVPLRVFCFIVSFCVLFACKMCTVLLPPGVNPNAVNKYTMSYHISSSMLGLVCYSKQDYQLSQWCGCTHCSSGICRHITGYLVLIYHNSNPLSIKAQRSFTMSGRDHPVTQCHIPEMNPCNSDVETCNRPCNDCTVSKINSWCA
jgi:hypothetical protein